MHQVRTQRNGQKERYKIVQEHILIVTAQTLNIKATIFLTVTVCCFFLIMIINLCAGYQNEHFQICSIKAKGLITQKILPSNIIWNLTLKNKLINNMINCIMGITIWLHLKLKVWYSWKIFTALAGSRVPSSKSVLTCLHKLVVQTHTTSHCLQMISLYHAINYIWIFKVFCGF